MSTSKHIDRICILGVVAALLISILLMHGAVLGIPAQTKAMEYETRLFDTSRVHTIDIVMEDWDGFLATAQSEEYTVCDVVIDGEAFSNVGIRGKGNTSLSTVASMNSSRYSFKIEFDQYNAAGSYYGLDKLSLNNLIQDNTMMKDYLVYRMMNEFGVAAPLCSYVYITVNGEDWGLYLAVEAVEESFLQRNYGSNYGDLYKPDNMNMGGGRGNGKDFSFEDFSSALENEEITLPEGFDPSQMGGMFPGGNSQGGFDPNQMGGMFPGGNSQGGFDPNQMGGMFPGGNSQGGFDPNQMGGMFPGGNSQGGFDPSQMGGMFPGGMGMNSGTTLQYIDDEISSYSTIFDSAKTGVTNGDKTRLIAALKALSEGKESAVDVEAVIRYFVVHNFAVNADSYTGSMVHNYYLYEENGQLSMIPWDYNLAFGTFQSGNADTAVNDDIDAPLSVTGTGRPMIDWIFASEEYTGLYHQYFAEFLDTVDIAAILSQAEQLIAPYVEKDPTKFCTYGEFETGVETLTAFCSLRSQSVAAQLAGEDGSVDASGITLSDMGTMGNGMGGGNPFGNGENPFQGTNPLPDSEAGGSSMPQMPAGRGDRTDMWSGQNTRPDGIGMEPGNGASVPGGLSWGIFAITLAVLAAGLIFALKYKR